MTKPDTSLEKEENEENEEKKNNDLRQVVLDQHVKARKKQADDNTQEYGDLEAQLQDLKKKKKLKNDELTKLLADAEKFLNKREHQSVSYKKEFEAFTTNSQVQEVFKVLALPISARFLVLWDRRIRLVFQLSNELTNPQKSNPELILRLMKEIIKQEQDYLDIQRFLRNPSYETYNKIPADFKSTNAPSPSETNSTELQPKPQSKLNDDDGETIRPKPNTP